MPLDTRRITGPEDCQSPYAFVEPSLPKPLVGENGVRNDGRKPDEVRPAFVKTGVVNQARGSAYIELRQTKIICAAYGPREVARREDFSMTGQLTCEVKFATFSCKRRRGHQQDAEERDLSTQVLEALLPAVCLDKFPKAQVNVFVTVLENDGGILAASIMAASVALAEAGVEMYDLVAACSGRTRGDTVLLDPTADEEYHPETKGENNSGTMTVAMMPSLRQVSALSLTGVVDCDAVRRVTQMLVDNCDVMLPVLQKCLLKSLQAKMESKVEDGSLFQ